MTDVNYVGFQKGLTLKVSYIQKFISIIPFDLTKVSVWNEFIGEIEDLLEFFLENSFYIDSKCIDVKSIIKLLFFMIEKNIIKDKILLTQAYCLYSLLNRHSSYFNINSPYNFLSSTNIPVIYNVLEKKESSALEKKDNDLMLHGFGSIYSAMEIDEFAVRYSFKNILFEKYTSIYLQENNIFIQLQVTKALCSSTRCMDGSFFSPFIQRLRGITDTRYNLSQFAQQIINYVDSTKIINTNNGKSSFKKKDEVKPLVKQGFDFGDIDGICPCCERSYGECVEERNIEPNTTFRGNNPPTCVVVNKTYAKITQSVQEAGRMDICTVEPPISSGIWKITLRLFYVKGLVDVGIIKISEKEPVGNYERYEDFCAFRAGRKVIQFKEIHHNTITSLKMKDKVTMEVNFNKKTIHFIHFSNENKNSAQVPFGFSNIPSPVRFFVISASHCFVQILLFKKLNSPTVDDSSKMIEWNYGK